MIIDCDTCVMREIGCSDCVVSALLWSVPGQSSSVSGQPVELDSSERAALGALADQGLVPPLRLVPAISSFLWHAQIATKPLHRAPERDHRPEAV